MPFNDLREFIAGCDKAGEVQQIEQEVDWNLEVGAIARRGCELSAPAPFFQKVKDYPYGYRIFANPLATFRRMAIAMDLDPDVPFKDTLNAYHERKQHPIKPRIVNQGPCKENVLTGDDIDLFRLQAPLIHEGDGGRYISTWHVIITRDPDSDWVNWGMYRQMIHDKNTLGGLVAPGQHIGIMYRQKYEARNQPMELAVAIGTEPITGLVGATPIPLGVSEADIVGAIRQEPIDLIKCETVDLEVPATSEIVIEGIVPPHERKIEGPFGEYAGYMAIPTVPRPLFKVTAITHRNDPILSMSCMGIPIDDGDIVSSIGYSSEFYSALRASGIPVTGVYVPPEFASTTVVVATKTPYANIASRIASCIWAASTGFLISKIIIVDEDVDPTNMREVMHAWATKCHPVRGTTVIPQAPIVPAAAFYSPEEKHYNVGANAYYDCTYPKRWPKEEKPRRSSFNDIYPEEIKTRVLDNWAKYGFSQ